MNSFYLNVTETDKNELEKIRRTDRYYLQLFERPHLGFWSSTQKRRLPSWSNTHWETFGLFQKYSSDFD